MPQARFVRCLVLPATLASVVVACRHHQPRGEAPSASAAPPAASASGQTAEADDGYKPLHPGYVNQRGPNGGFIAARTAPPPVPSPAVHDAIIDTIPDEVKIPPPKEENGHCGELDLEGGEKVVLDCITDDYSMVVGAAKPVASGEDLSSFRKKRELPKLVDHRKDGTEGPVLSQGKTPACTAFSLVTVANHAANRYLGHPGNLSPMHAWARYHAAKMMLAENDNVGRGLADLTTFPFDAKLANEWAHGGHVDQAALRRADAHSLVEITNITRLDGGSMTEIKSALAAGQDVWFAMRGAHVLQKPKKNAEGESIVSQNASRGTGRGGHAIVLAGYQETPHGTFYLIHNSWGTKWGTDGYAWIWEKTLRPAITEAFVLQVRPLEGARTRRPPPSHHYATCSAGLAPDAVTAQCVPPCGDNGPRVNGVCPTAGQCPDGEVNLDGKCELAAPMMDKVMADGVKVTCGLSGCTYVVPSGQEGCSSGRACAISCGAPRFMLGSGTHGLTCNG